jgi:hypothetical protein
MKTLSNFLNRIANWKSLLVFLALYVFFSGYVFKNAEIKINELAGKTIGIIDITFGFNPQQTLDMVAGYGDAARAYYAQIEMTADAIYPIVYAFLLGIILTFLFRSKSYSWVNVLPFITMLFDYAENINIVTLLNTFPQQSMAIASLCEVFKLLKWLSLGVIVVIIVYGLIMKLLNRSKVSV